MKLLFGHGYLGSRVARLWREAGSPVTVVTRSEEKARELRNDGYGAIVADVGDPRSLAHLPPAETVLFTVGYDRKSSQTASIHDVYAGGVGNVLAALASTGSSAPAKFIYISSTGVYGDAEGDWVDERTECRPVREGGKACLAAEQAIAAHPLGANAVVLRLAGIYGPGRIPRREPLLRGEPIDAPADGYLNLIHVDDAARVAVAVEQARTPATYCVADGRPGLRREYYGELARLLNAPEPKFAAPCLDSPAALRAASDKRISNAKLLREIDCELRFPSFREGLAAIVAMDSP
ncbi:MAG: SDR family oxidoreductase [Planctomycetia bacterium]|nr:SDR family oxidoreductase [Planctomycetia bacterium]